MLMVSITYVKQDDKGQFDSNHRQTIVVLLFSGKLSSVEVEVESRRSGPSGLSSLGQLNIFEGRNACMSSSSFIVANYKPHFSASKYEDLVVVESVPAVTRATGTTSTKLPTQPFTKSQIVGGTNGVRSRCEEQLLHLNVLHDVL